MNLRLRGLVVRAIAALSCCGLIGPCFAAPQWCSGTIGVLWVDWAGNVYVNPSWRGEHIRVCNLHYSITVGSVSVQPLTCTAWLTLMRQGKQSAGSIVFQYDDLPGACSAIPSYNSAPTPAYVMLL